MNKKFKLVFLITMVSISIVIIGFSNNENVNISDESQMCIDCHQMYTPGIVSDWKKSRHSNTTLAEAFEKEEITRRISITEPGELNTDIIVGCYECHALNPDMHDDNHNHFGFNINTIVSPNDCATCHIEEHNQYANSKKAHALDILRKNDLYNVLIDATLGISEYSNGKLNPHSALETTKNQTCYACHGTDVQVRGMKTIQSAIGELEVPDLTNYPNQGVGRINPDGSKGSCASCHPRHSFSIEIARKPATCGQCHLEPDVPAYNVYKESKHGNIYYSKTDDWNFSNVPWELGTDFTAPTCAVCHNSLIVNNSGQIIAERTHDFGNRLWIRIFGLIYTHNQPISGKTYEIKLSDDTPLPVSLDGTEFAVDYLIDDETAAEKEQDMKNICMNCHSTSWADGFFESFDNTIKETDKIVKTSTELITEYWKLNPDRSENPFDDYLEKVWIKNWLYYANSIRYAAAMSGPDYATFKNGWYDMNMNLMKMYKEINNK